jgi:hypothetical protein
MEYFPHLYMVHLQSKELTDKDVLIRLLIEETSAPLTKRPFERALGAEVNARDSNSSE